MRLPLVCVIFLVALSLPAQNVKLTASPEELITFDCAQELGLHSPSIPNKTRFILSNKSHEAIKIFWISRVGRRIPYNNNRPIETGTSFPQATYEGDIWVVTDRQDRCLAIFAAGKLDTIINFSLTERISPSTAIPPPTSSPSPLKRTMPSSPLLVNPPPPIPWDLDTGKNQQNVVGRQQNHDLSELQDQVLFAPAMAAALPHLPDVSPPLYDDPSDREQSKRQQELMQAFAASLRENGSLENPYAILPKFALARADEAAAQYGSSDPRSIAAMEDATAILMSMQDLNGAAALVDKAIRLRESEGTRSVYYWKALKMRCTLEVQRSAEPQLPVCEQALRVRLQQPGSTPLELATWLRLLGRASSYLNRDRSLEYQERAADYYRKVPGISPAFLAAEYRNLTILAFSFGKIEHGFQLNETTNQYLCQGDGHAKTAMISAEVLKNAGRSSPISRAQDMWASLSNPTPEQQKQRDLMQQQMKQWEAAGFPTSQSPLLVGRDLSKLTPEQREQLEKANAMMAAAMKSKAAMEAPTTRPQDPYVSSMLAYMDALGATRGISGMPDQPVPEQGNLGDVDCEKLARERGGKDDPKEQQNKLDQVSGLWTMTLPFYRARSAEENLRFFASLGFFWTSMLQMCDGRDESAKSANRAEEVNAQSSSGLNPFLGYATMVHFKGAFAESIAPRKVTSLPGYGENYDQALTAAEKSVEQLTAAFMPFLPPQKKKEFSKLPPEERLRAFNGYYEQLKKENPEQAARLEKQFHQTPDGAEAIGNIEQFQVLARDEKSYSQAQPLNFLNMLGPHEVFIDFYGYKVMLGANRGREQYLAFISDNHGPLRKLRLGPAAPIDSSVKSLTRAVKGGDDLAPVWKNLQQLILRPILNALPTGTEKVWLSPDGMLAFVPFASLLVDMDASVRIGIIPSPYDFVRVRRNKELPSGRVLFVGDLDYGSNKYPYASLEQAHEELEVLSRHAAAAHLHTASLTGSKITKPVVIGQLQGVRFLHFSTHGFLKNQFDTEGKRVLPGGIALSLANSGAPDSFLNAEDIYKINLSEVELVTLSACETGEGTPIEGQGLLGFQTALMAAGTRSLLFSLWRAPANEATTIFMERFYDGVWKNHLPKAEALRQAQIQVRSDPRFGDPRNWATWVLVGDAW